MTHDERYTRRDSLRLRTFDYSARRVYFVTIVAHERRRIFDDARVAAATLGCLLDAREEMRFNLYVYCLMPDHLHLLVGTGASGKTLGALCGAFKSLSTRAFWRWHTGKLWQRQFFDRVIRDEKEYFEARDYVRLNPVRKNLVATWQEWRYTGEVDKLYRQQDLEQNTSS